MTHPVRVSTRDHQIIKKIANKEDWTYIKTLEKAIRFFAKAKRIIKE